jgi:hypothetical protein
MRSYVPKQERKGENMHTHACMHACTEHSSCTFTFCALALVPVRTGRGLSKGLSLNCTGALEGNNREESSQDGTAISSEKAAVEHEEGSVRKGSDSLLQQQQVCLCVV